MRVTIFIVGLGVGGAELQFSHLAHGLAQRGYEVHFVTVFAGGRYWDRLSKDASISVCSLFPHWDIKLSLSALKIGSATLKLRNYLKRENIDVLYSSLEVGNWIAGVVAHSMPSLRWICGLRGTNMARSTKMTLIFKSLSWISNRADLAVSNSYAGRDYYTLHGYRLNEIEVISNGIDASAWERNREKRAFFRQQLDLDEDTVLIGMIGRIVPIKNYETYIKVAKQMLATDKRLHFIAVGSGVDRAYVSSLQDEKVDRLQWLGTQEDMVAVYSALDVYCSTSAGEGTSNALTEAMACKLPVVVADVGDNQSILGEPCPVVHADDVSAFVSALSALLERLEAWDGESARKRIIEHYSIEKMVSNTDACIKQLVSRPS